MVGDCTCGSASMLLEVQLKDDKYGDVKRTVQVCNPPYDKKFEDDPRYSGAGKLAPKSHADFAFVEHMVYHMVYHMDEDDGRVAVVAWCIVLWRCGRNHSEIHRKRLEPKSRRYEKKQAAIDEAEGFLKELGL